MAPLGNNSTASRLISSNEVSWQGPSSIEGYDIYRGLNLTDLFMQNISKLKELKIYSDISQVDFTDITNIKPQNLNQALTFLIEAFVALRNQEIAPTQEVVSRIFNVTYKCLYNSQGIQEFTSNDQIIQAIIDKVCNLDTSIQEVKTNVNTLAVTIQNTLNVVNAIQLEFEDVKAWTTESLNSGLPVSLEGFFTEVRDDIEQKDLKIGTVADFDNARTIQGDATLVNTEYGNNPAYTINPTNTAMQLKNISVIAYDLLERVKNLEIETSLSSCADIKINFNGEFNSNRTELTITANNSTGTYIPDVFVDNGSTLVITDAMNVSKTIDITLTNNFSTVLNLTDLELNILVDYNVVIYYQFRNTQTNKICTGFSNKFFNYINNDTQATINTSTNGSAYIEYLNPTTNTFDNLTVQGGFTYNIPSNASIVMIMKTDDLTLSSFNSGIHSQLQNALPNVTYNAILRPIVYNDGKESIYSHLISKYSIYKYNEELNDFEFYVRSNGLINSSNTLMNSFEITALINQLNALIPKHLGQITNIGLIESGVSTTNDIQITFKAPLLPVTPRFGFKLRYANMVVNCTECETDVEPTIWINSTQD